MKHILMTLGLLCFFTYSALGQTFSCERTRLNSSGFSSLRAAESWFNKVVTIKSDLEQKTATYKGSTSDLWIREDNKRLKATFVRKMKGGKRITITFTFLANSEVHAELGQAGGYKIPGGAVYKCSGWSGSL